MHDITMLLQTFARRGRRHGVVGYTGNSLAIMGVFYIADKCPAFCAPGEALHAIPSFLPDAARTGKVDYEEHSRNRLVWRYKGTLSFTKKHEANYCLLFDTEQTEFYGPRQTFTNFLSRRSEFFERAELPLRCIFSGTGCHFEGRKYIFTDLGAVMNSNLKFDGAFFRGND